MKYKYLLVYIYFKYANRTRFDKTQVTFTTILMFSILMQVLIQFLF